MKMESLKKRNSQRGLAGLAWLVIMTTLSLLGLILGPQFISPRIPGIAVSHSADIGNPVALTAVQAELSAFCNDVENCMLVDTGPEIGMPGYRLFDDFSADNASVANLVDNDIIREFCREVEEMDVDSGMPELGAGNGR